VLADSPDTVPAESDQARQKKPGATDLEEPHSQLVSEKPPATDRDVREKDRATISVEPSDRKAESREVAVEMAAVTAETVQPRSINIETPVANQVETNAGKRDVSPASAVSVLQRFPANQKTPAATKPVSVAAWPLISIVLGSLAAATMTSGIALIVHSLVKPVPAGIASIDRLDLHIQMFLQTFLGGVMLLGGLLILVVAALAQIARTIKPGESKHTP
jgi:hypothetical protein